MLYIVLLYWVIFKMADIQEFINNPSVAYLQNTELRKNDWIALAKYYKIDFPSDIRKHELKERVIKELVDNEKLSKEALTLKAETDSELILIKRMEYELELKKIEEREKERNHELRMLELENKERRDSGNNFDITKYLKIIPNFDEADPDEFFSQFEKLSSNMKWPEDSKIMLAQSAFKGKAQVVFNSLPDVSDYDYVKECILKSYERVPESYRLKFRNMKMKEGMNFMEYSYCKERHFTRWLQSSKVDDFNGLKKLILLEEFKRQMPPAIKLYLEEKEPSDIQNAAILAENYVLTHKGGSFSTVSRAGGKWSSRQSNNDGQSRDCNPSKGSGQTSTNSLTNKDSILKSNIKCFKCSGIGHVARNCATKRQTSEVAGEGVVQCMFRPKGEDITVGEKCINDPCNVKGAECFKHFMSRGFVSKDGPGRIEYPVEILRDTAASHSLLLKGSFPQIGECFTGESTIINGVGGPITSPYARLYLESDYMTGFITVTVTDSIPVEGVSFLLGNDIAGKQVFPNLTVTDTPSVDSPTKQLEEEYPDLFPVCIVTRSMKSKKEETLKATRSDSSDNPEEDLHIGGLFDTSSDRVVNPKPRVSSTKIESLPITREELVQGQHQDPTLAKCFDEIVSQEECVNHRCCYYLKKGVLMRKYRPFNLPSTNTWAENHQIIVPSNLRESVLQLSHDNMGGHLGCGKTSSRILQHFYWPGLRKDVAKYCKSCRECQLAGRPNEVLKPVPLRPIPVVEEPFSKIIIDCVGPLPKTKRGNNYLLTLMCATTRYPDAIPIKKINAKTIVDKIINFFTLYGIPKIVQSDQGSNFTSDLFKNSMKQLGIKQYLATAYHPESQGVLERFHQTFKSMLRKYCLETGKEWDDGINLLLFAIRESKQESLGFSPHQLVFPHEVRGPLRVLKDSWLDNSEQVTLGKYVQNFRNKLKEIRQFAKENLCEAQNAMKTNFDRKSENRHFGEGDKVLLLLPTYKTPLQAKYEGPYEVARKCGSDRYIIKTPGRRKTERRVHANNMKLFQQRPVVMSVQAKASREPEEDHFMPMSPSLNNSVILANPESLLHHLETDRREDVNILLSKFPSVFSDVPQQSVVASHDVVLVRDTVPIKQSPYRVNPAKREILRQEVKFLLDHGLAEPSHSEWASPCLLVTKPDGSFRLCTDYRKVNQVTRTDSYPLPRMDDILDDLGNARFLTKLDLLKGYYQVSLTNRAKHISAFVTPDGLYQYRVMPFGMKNAPSTFQRMMNNVISGLTNVRAYLDDLVIFDESWTEHIFHLNELLNKLALAKLTVNLAKSSFAHATISYLGHQVGKGQMTPLTAKIEAIHKITPPTNRKELRRYLGMVGYYRRFCPNFSQVASPLTDLISPKVKFEWSCQCQEAFNKLKHLLVSHPVLKSPDFIKCFKVQVDACDTGVGAVLLQESEADGFLHPVCYLSRKFKPHQRAYSIIEKELLALVIALENWDVYLGQNSPITVYSDHSPLQFLAKMKNKNQRLTRWALFLQKYILEVRHIKGKNNVIADTLSRVN